MLRHKHRKALVQAGGCFSALLAGLVAGCSGNGTSAPAGSPAADYSGASASTAAEVTASAGTMTMLQSSASGGAMAEAVRDGVAQETAAGGKGCGTVVVNATGPGGNVTDETITYTLPACEFVGVRGLESLAITGALELVQPDSTGFNFTAKPAALEYAFTSDGVTNSETRTGSRQITATASGATLVNAISTQFVKAGAATGTFVNTLTLGFTPASGPGLAVGQPLPNGELSANGNVSWTPATTGAVTETFTVSTVTPLAYDAACATTSASPFDAGQLRVAIADGSVKTYAQITWTACGAPVVKVI